MTTKKVLGLLIGMSLCCLGFRLEAADHTVPLDQLTLVDEAVSSPPAMTDSKDSAYRGGGYHGGGYGGYHGGGYHGGGYGGYHGGYYRGGWYGGYYGGGTTCPAISYYDPYYGCVYSQR